MNMHITTLSDVARLAGVSIGTASKALNGRADVNARTRERVRQAAAQLNFVPNTLASGLLAGRSGTVGLLTNDLEGRFSLPILMGAEDAFEGCSVSVFLCDARGDPQREQRHLRALLGRRVDGLLVVGDKTDPRASLGADLAIPAVYVYAPSDSPLDVCVTTDDRAAGRIAATHLMSGGCARIGYIAGDPGYAAARDRASGAAAAIREAGLTLVGGVPLYGHWTESWGREGTRMLLAIDPEIDAIACGSDLIARGAIDLLRECSKDVPNDIAVIGHDNWEPIASQARPSLTTIDMHLERLGHEAARLLSTRIAGKTTQSILVVPPQLLVRRSTRPEITSTQVP